VIIGNYQRMHDHALVDSYGGGSAYEDNIEVGRGFSYETFAFQGNFARNLALVSRSYGFGGILRGKVEGNSALASLGDGFLLHSQSDADVSGNASIGNLTGLRTDGSAARMQDNLLLGNAGCGADLNYYSTSGGAPPLSFDANGVYGNGVGRYGKNGSSGIAASSCGVEADRLDLQDNFWGSPSGPGGDPADAVYGIGNVSVPYATKEPKLKRKQRKPTL
jgi:hypothetical protein